MTMGEIPHKTRARSVAVLGTGSDVGKSLVAAGVCRLLCRAGANVAPFKAQNMSLNSFVTPDGGEMGRAQVLQAQACGVTPSVAMNPILLKPETDCQSQVIVQGKVWERQEAKEYFNKKAVLWDLVKSSYEELATTYEVIVIEGAGSAAEMNLRDRDIVNWPVVEMADAAVILVADIDRGGVFAQVIGTMDLLSPGERQRVIGVVINKFRGDLSLFDDGIKIIEERTGVPVLGVLPYLRNLELDQEDSVAIERFRMTPFEIERVNVAVVLLPHMSNFTDFNQLAAEPDVALRYVASPQELHGADVIILPGSKTTMADLDYLRKAGFGEAFMAHMQRGAEIMGVCGGFQMLGSTITDPKHIETGSSSKGLELLDVETELLAQKRTVQVRAHSLLGSWGTQSLVEGYEIHMGVTVRDNGVLPCFQIISHSETFPSPQPSSQEAREFQSLGLDGAMSSDGLVWGTYIHGVFDQPGFRREWLNRVRVRKNLQALDVETSQAVSNRLVHAIDRWADHVGTYLDMQPIFSAIELRKGDGY
jgi:adenosylcobyric acid synthase